MKKIISIISLIILSISFSFADIASELEVDVIIDGVDLEIYDEEQQVLLPSFIQNSRTMVPLRGFSEAFGLSSDQLKWYGDTRSIELTTNASETALLTIGEADVYMDDKTLVMDVAPVIVNNRTYIPLSAVSSLFGVTPEWDGKTRTVTMDPSHYVMSRFNLEFEYDIREGFVLKNDYVDNRLYRLYKNDHNLNSLVKSFDFKIDSRDMNTVFEEFLYEKSLSADDFNVLSNSKVSVFRSIKDESIAFVQLENLTVIIETYNISPEELIDLVDTLEEVK